MESRVSVDSPRYFVYLLTPPELRDTAVGSNSIYVSRGRGFKKNRYIVLIIQKSNVYPIQRAAGGKFCCFTSSFVISPLILMSNIVSVLDHVSIFLDICESFFRYVSSQDFTYPR